MHWSLETLEGEKLNSGQSAVNAAPQASSLVCELDFSDQVTYDNMRNLVFIAELWQAEQFITRQVAPFAPIKHLSLSDPAITVELQNQQGELFIDLVARSLAMLVEVSIGNTDVVFNDNYFNLPAGRTRQISCPMPAGWSLSRVEEEIHIRSVYDSYSTSPSG